MLFYIKSFKLHLAFTENVLFSLDKMAYFMTLKEKDIQNPLILKRLQSIPCGNYTAEKCFKWFIHPLSPDEFFE